MAKSAKQQHTLDVELSEKSVSRFYDDIFARLERIETAKGSFMNTARREKEAMDRVYEGMAHQGVSQKAARTSVKIIRMLDKVRGWIADLAEEDRKQAEQLAKLRKDAQQLSLFPASELPTTPKKAKAPKKPKAPKLTVVETQQQEDGLAEMPPAGAA